MDRKILDFGVELTYCSHRASCPGIVKGLVVNEPSCGIYPRGFHVSPPQARFEDIEVVVLGQNPGRCDSFARHLYMTLDTYASPELLVATANQALVDALDQLPYWKNVGKVLEALWPNGRHKPLMSVEVAYCENEAAVNYPGQATLNYCSSKHLVKQLQYVKDGAYVMCVGRPAASWFKKYEFQGRFRWFVVDHLSGSRGAVSHLLNQNGLLKDSVKTIWSGLVNGTTNGVHLAKPNY